MRDGARRFQQPIPERSHGGWITRLASPNDFDGPSQSRQSFSLSLVSPEVVCNLGSPIVGIGSWPGGSLFAGVSVPETAMDKYDSAQPGKGQVRLTWKIATVQREAQSQPMKVAANHQFGRGILTPDPSHVS